MGSMDGMESLARFNSNDSDRTRKLKEVLKSSASLHRDIHMTLGGVPSKASKYGMDEAPSSADKDKDAAPTKSSRTLPPLPELLAMCSEGDGDIVEESPAIGRDLSPVLRTCGQRISGLSTRLSNMEEKLVLAGGKLPPREDDEDTPIEIVPRGQEAPAAARMRADSATARSLNQHARFGPLEDLDDIFENNKGYDRLRDAFARRGRLHPNLLLLTDQTLKDLGEFREAVWRKPQDEDLNLGTNRSGQQKHWKVNVKDGIKKPPLLLDNPPMKARALRGQASAPNLR
mmetsp:Transcript_106804/g.189814  ORF Transcript_106804/g.189814 Transcript_106804/m.189814 type:complete len:287 (-) Transcript_106804:57-917(-)|eukprot:CAMPEP_0197656308 /NCGR_PEP_ID=MMETSP1338-20131121/41255_1 /TAXON_ID=43686 ORGANISM="Pelagodinium beii, Strain RCC1491" /NCGR_SAMPLE_ID=MMETSP1338 /ASSEMBLY_ACC=CAM_ASM_000754 /LENGTH=286 /DNA_ID=CAMNT_0043232245 /DNA_START=71 /DNA_END=931 /DNA_ORIENTATION=-